MRGRRRGVVLVELALAMPFLVFLMLGMAEAAFLFAAHADQDRRTAALAEWAAQHPDATEADWSAIVVTVGPCASATRSVADDLVTVAMTCSYSPVVTSNLWGGLGVSTEAVAALSIGDVLEVTSPPEGSPMP